MYSELFGKLRTGFRKDYLKLRLLYLGTDPSPLAQDDGLLLEDPSHFFKCVNGRKFHIMPVPIRNSSPPPNEVLSGQIVSWYYEKNVEGLAMKRISKVKVLSGYRLELEFDDGVSGKVGLSDSVGNGVFAVWRDPLVFEQVRIGSSGELVWGEQIDLCPDALYLKVTGKKPEDIFPALRNQATHA